MNSTHNCSHTQLYKCWAAIKARCSNSNIATYANYGGRGISVCKDWMEFVPFQTWAISHGYKKHLTIERLDNDGNYEPSNCVWATRYTQANNSRNNVKVTFRGMTLNATEWARKVGIEPQLLLYRIRSGWPTEKALTVSPTHHDDVSFRGKTQSLSLWAKELGINYSTLNMRLFKYGWSVEKTLTISVRGREL